MAGQLATGAGRARLAGVNPAGRRLLNELWGYWPGQAASGTELDRSGRGGHLVDNNTVTGNPGPTTPGGRFPLARQFTVVNSESLSIVEEAAPWLNVAGQVSFHLSLFCYLGDMTSARVLVSKWGIAAAVGDQQYDLFLNSATGTLRFFVTDTAGVRSYAESPAVSAATWYRVDAGRDVAAGVIYLRLSSAGVFGTLATTAFTGSILDPSPAVAFKIGADGFNFMDGRICDVGFWRRAQTAAEQQYRYNGGQGRQLVAGRGFV